jgi:2-hydroxychromene-2-carboxylate isomerase
MLKRMTTATTPRAQPHELEYFFDPVSPYAYLAFERLPHALQGLSYSVTYTPVLFAGMLKHWGQLGPAEIAPKREWTYRQVMWLAHSLGVPLRMPSAHPFNPLALLRLAVACGVEGHPNRWQCEVIFRHVWQSAAPATADDAARIEQLTATLAPARSPVSEDVKSQLRAFTDGAIASGIFGVPTVAVDGKLFWGLDALPMLTAYLRGDAWFDDAGHWQAASDVPAGIHRVH